MRASLFVVVVLGSIVWAFALVGFLSVAQAIGAVAALPRPRLASAGIPGVPAYPGATCSEFRAEVFGDERVTEIEYVVRSSIPEVLEYYRGALARCGWDVVDTGWFHGEWACTLSSGTRHGVLEIEHRDGVTEVEVELVEPATD